MVSSPFPGMDPFLEINPDWEVFHGWFIRELARLCINQARELGCEVDVERDVYGQEPTGEFVLLGEPDVVARHASVLVTAHRDRTPGAVTLAEPQAIHEVILDRDEMARHKQEYIVVRESGDWPCVLAVVELLSFANKQGSYVAKYREKRSRMLTSTANFMEIDFLRDGENPSRDLFPELPRTPYFVFVVRKHGMGRHEEGYPIRLQDPLPVIGLPLGPDRPDLALDLSAAFRSAYDLSHRPHWRKSYQAARVPGSPLAEEDETWVAEMLKSHFTNALS